MKRRTFIKSTIAAGSIATMGVTGWCFTRGIDSNALEKILTRAFRDKTDIYLVGQAYLDKVPSENDLHLIKELLDKRFCKVKAYRIDHNFEKVIEEDFLRGDILEVKDWTLSQTEVRLCAFMLLLKKQSSLN